MQIQVLAVGRLKSGEEHALAERYRKRAAQAGHGLGFRAIEVIELRESKARDAAHRVTEEAIALATLLPERAAIVALDEGGRSLGSAGMAEDMRRWRDTGYATIAFVVGGPDGLGAAIRDRADLILAFGAATWPHQLVRVMLFEQIYRAMTIIAGHPYHRE